MLNVLFASDDNYASFLLISMNSLLINNISSFEKINIIILDDDIHKKNKAKLINLATKFECNISFIKTKEIKKMDINILSLKRNLNKSSLTTYARLFISNLLPEHIDKVLYLDCDSIIVSSLKDLWNEDISDYYCAGVLDCINTSVKLELNFSRNDSYINAGVLLINLKNGGRIL